LALASLSWPKEVPTKAETTWRWVLPPWARALRIKWARRRCQVQESTRETADLTPSGLRTLRSATLVASRGLFGEKELDHRPHENSQIKTRHFNLHSQKIESAISHFGNPNDGYVI